MANKNILALDASTKRTGYALISEGEYHYGAIVATSTKLEKRLITMRDKIKELVKEYNIDTIVIEDVRPDTNTDNNKNDNFHKNAHTARVLTWLQGVIAVGAYEENPNIVFEMMGASSWRSKVHIQKYCIKRDNQKQMDIEYANKCGFPLKAPLTAAQDDEADAIGIFMAYCSSIKTPTNEKESAF